MHVIAGTGTRRSRALIAATVLLALLVLAAAAAGMRSGWDESVVAHAAGGPGAPAALAIEDGTAVPAPPDGSGAGSQTPAAEADPRRAFDHAQHESVSCTRCHGTGGEHRALLVRNSRDCAACHHDDAAPRACSSCHDRATLPEAGLVAQQLSLGVWAGSQERKLPFGHAVHDAVECRECHERPVTLALERSCASCHEAHHTAASDCAACHAPAVARAEHVHGAAVHLSCAGSGCHAAAVAPAPDLSRGLCIACHAQQLEHEPGEACARCHLLATAGGGP